MTTKAEEPDLEPAEYEIPLTDYMLIELGRFSAVFSQVDYLLSVAISMTTKTPFWAMQVMLDNATSGTKINMFRKIVPKIEDKKAKEIAKDALDRLNKIVQPRNYIMHGLWAQVADFSAKKVRPGCTTIGMNPDVVWPEELRKLSNKGAKISRLLGDLNEHLSPVKDQKWTKPRRLVVATQNVDLDNWPDWLGVSAPLTKQGYPDPGEMRPKPPHQR